MAPLLSPPSELKLTIHGIHTITPAEDTDLQPLYLSQIDQVVAYIVETVYFYPANPDKPSDHADVTSKLRTTLAKLLVPYHFMAGRLRLSKNGRLEIDCNRAGALFADASTELHLSDLGDVTRPNLSFRSLVLQPVDAHKMTDTPLLMMQVTRFKCGGFTIGFSMNHAVFDGIGAAEFVMNFCSLTKGNGLVVEPNPDRTCLAPRDPPQIKFDHPEYLKLSEIPQDIAFTTKDLADLDFSAITLSQQQIYKIFPFTLDMLNSLKEKALQDGALKKCSSFDAIAAHIWQARTKAIEMDPQQQSKMLFAVDIRSRVNPPLPKGFAGNGVFSAFASVAAGDLHSQPFSFCVGKVQEASDVITDEYIRSSIDWGSVYGGVPNLPGGIFLSAWWKLPFFLMDFGWGKPIYAGPIMNAMVEFVLLLSNGTQDGLNLYLALKPEEMEKFEKLVYDF